jgi:hypothetical protein
MAVLGALACALVAGLGAPASADPVTTPATITGLPKRVELTVPSTNTWTQSKVVLRAGKSATIAATGEIYFGPDQLTHIPPNGIAWSQRCLDLGAVRHAPFPAPGLPCYSLIARVGNGKPQAVGASGEVHADVTGPVFLGLNDNYIPDNSGSYAATISVAADALATPVSSSNVSVPVKPIAIGAIVLLLVLALVWLNARRRPAFSLKSDLLIGRVRVRIGQTRVVERVGSDGKTAAFAVTRDDFGEHLPAERRERFAWRGLSFHAVRSRMPFGPAHVEVERLGQHVGGSSGVVRGKDGFMRGRVPKSLHPAWLFTLDNAAICDDDSLEGDLTVIVADGRFDSESAQLARSVQKLPGQIGSLVGARQTTVSTAARVPAASEQSGASG